MRSLFRISLYGRLSINRAFQIFSWSFSHERKVLLKFFASIADVTLGIIISSLQRTNLYGKSIELIIIKGSVFKLKSSTPTRENFYFTFIIFMRYNFSQRTFNKEFSRNIFHFIFIFTIWIYFHWSFDKGLYSIYVNGQRFASIGDSEDTIAALVYLDCANLSIFMDFLNSCGSLIRAVNLSFDTRLIEIIWNMISNNFARFYFSRTNYDVSN